MDDNTSGWLGRSLSYYISRTRWWLIGNLLSFPDSYSLRRGQRRRHLGLTIRRWGLRGLPCIRYKAINGYGLPGHHIFTGKRISGWQVGYKLLGLHYRSLKFNKVLGVSGVLNKDFVDSFVGQLSKTPRHTLHKLVLQWG